MTIDFLCAAACIFGAILLAYTTGKRAAYQERDKEDAEDHLARLKRHRIARSAIPQQGLN